jgi:Mannosylglycerate hydrolase MGH1-like glycoside hydrolase domain
MNAEQQRLAENNTSHEPWHFWGPYLADRAWGTVREDYSANGDAWNFFPHDHARSRVYRWNEDGLGGISDFKGQLCFAFAFWNERDPILKERLFGLTGPEGNHGEDVKEVYWFLDNTPSHSFMRMIYRYPQAAFPYEELVGQNAGRSKAEGEFELWDTGIFDGNRFFDIEIEYAKASPFDILIRARATNCGPDPAPLHLLPTLWFRNTWSWGRDNRKPDLQERTPAEASLDIIDAKHHSLGVYHLYCKDPDRLLFTENESNLERLWRVSNRTPHVKDAINDAVIQNKPEITNPNKVGTKASAHYRFLIPPGESRTIRLRLESKASANRSRHPGSGEVAHRKDPFVDFDEIFALREREADEFYKQRVPNCLSQEHCAIQRQALAGMLWTKQFYHYIVEQWLEGDPGQPTPPPEHQTGRNAGWRHIYNERVMSMPDTWEFPWYASWDLAFHCLPLALIDSQFAKAQLDIIVREWYQHPNGEMPAYEWNFNDVNPPVITWAAWRVYQMERKQTGKGDRAFLETIFHKMLLTFTWWVNRKDSEGNNIFQGGFLGLDNVGVFDRNETFSDGTRLEQADGTAWMGMFCLNLMRIAIELAMENHVYENIATKFFEHFLGIAAAMNNLGGRGIGLWDEEDEFYYDVLHTPGGRYVPLRVRSVVGLLPLLAVETIQPQLINALPGFKERLEWYLIHRPDLASLVSRWQEPGIGERRLVAITRGHRMKCLLRRMLDPAEFLSDYGVRSVSKYHKEHPYILTVRGENKVVSYEPAESQTGIFGGNSNWRGPVWFPINYLLIESLQQFHHYYGDDFKVECPTGSGRFLHLREIANELSNRLINLWLRDGNGDRPFSRASAGAFRIPADRDRYLFHEYFHGDTGGGLGASHQTGWTALVAKLIQQQGEFGTIRR